MDVCNALVPPTQGCSAGALRLNIPVDFAARIATGQQVPGCTYASLQPATDAGGLPLTVLAVSDQIQAQLAIPAVVNALSAPLQTQAAALTTALQTAVVVTAQAEVITP